MYCPPGFVDGEDGAGNQITGNWRGDDDPCAGLTSLGQVGGNRQEETLELTDCTLYYNFTLHSFH